VRDEGEWRSLLLKQSLRREAEASEMFRNVSFNSARGPSPTLAEQVAKYARIPDFCLQSTFSGNRWRVLRSFCETGANAIRVSRVPRFCSSQFRGVSARARVAAICNETGIPRCSTRILKSRLARACLVSQNRRSPRVFLPFLRHARVSLDASTIATNPAKWNRLRRSLVIPTGGDK
jgi:hypothetical protein